MYRAIHRYPARLDAMLAYLTRRLLDRTPVSLLCPLCTLCMLSSGLGYP